MPPKLLKLSELKVCDLKTELEERDLEATGKKIELQERLRQALIDSGENPEDYIFEIPDEASDIRKLIDDCKILNQIWEESSRRLDRVLHESSTKAEESSGALEEELKDHSRTLERELHEGSRKVEENSGVLDEELMEHSRTMERQLNESSRKAEEGSGIFEQKLEEELKGNSGRVEENYEILEQKLELELVVNPGRVEESSGIIKHMLERKLRESSGGTERMLERRLESSGFLEQVLKQGWERTSGGVEEGLLEFGASVGRLGRLAHSTASDSDLKYLAIQGLISGVRDSNTQQVQQLCRPRTMVNALSYISDHETAKQISRNQSRVRNNYAEGNVNTEGIGEKVRRIINEVFATRKELRCYKRRRKRKRKRPRKRKRACSARN